jgi:hypothetical protein
MVGFEGSMTGGGFMTGDLRSARRGWETELRALLLEEL